MLNKDGNRELAYLVKVESITPMNADRLECAHIGGWHCVVGKGEFKVGDPAVYFEIDSQLPDIEPFSSMEFLKSKHFKIKTQKIRGEVSQGLLMPVSAFGWQVNLNNDGCFDPVSDHDTFCINDESRFLTKVLKVTYAVPEDNKRKAKPLDKFTQLQHTNPKLFRNPVVKILERFKFGRKILVKMFWKKSDEFEEWPDNKFKGVKRTDQERVENMAWVLKDKTPFIRTQKCDGSSGTYILSKKGRNKYEFYVCSRNNRLLKSGSNQKQLNQFWEVAEKYDIENKMKDYLQNNPDVDFVCWQGEICSPIIQSNPHNLVQTHMYCFHMTDSKTGRFDIREAKKIWEHYYMEVVPIDEELYILPDTMEELKATADGMYDPMVCEGNKNCPREGYVYYKSTDPTFSFKNVSNKYLLSKKG